MIRRRLAAVPGAVKAHSALQTVRAWLRFAQDFRRFRRLSSGVAPRFPLRWADRVPMLHDRTPNTAFDRHYLYHPAWAARILRQTSPAEHVDISSSLHFCSIVSAFLPIRFYDYRPCNLPLSDLSSGRADLIDLPFPTGSIASLSCMHVVEHIGLGRYGDPLDPEGDLKAIAELKRVLAPGGNLLFVVPVGRPRIHFNAHRIYSYASLRKIFDDLELEQSALVPDHAAAGDLLIDPPPALFDAQRYGCGCFWWRSARRTDQSPDARNRRR